MTSFVEIVKQPGQNWARNRDTSLHEFFNATFSISVSGKRKNFIHKIYQIVSGNSMSANSQDIIIAYLTTFCLLVQYYSAQWLRPARKKNSFSFFCGILYLALFLYIFYLVGQNPMLWLALLRSKSYLVRLWRIKIFLAILANFWPFFAGPRCYD